MEFWSCLQRDSLSVSLGTLRSFPPRLNKEKKKSLKHGDNTAEQTENLELKAQSLRPHAGLTWERPVCPVRRGGGRHGPSPAPGAASWTERRWGFQQAGWQP